jgi:hypothetical protein
VTLFSGPEGKDETVIRLAGYVDPIPMGVIEMSPRKTELGDLRLNKENAIRIILKNTGDAPLTVTRIVSQKFKTIYFDSTQKGAQIIQSGEEVPFTLAIIPNEAGRFLDSLLIYSDARNDIGNGYKGILTGNVK